MGILFGALVLILTIFLFAAPFKFRFHNARRRNFGEDLGNTGGSAERNTETVELVKDDVCGRFILREVSKEWIKDGVRHYFCCDDCRKRYIEANAFRKPA